MTDLAPAVREAGLLAPGATVVVLLSGGRDSVCLLDVCARICGPNATTALHVNYGLRDGADEDERHCEQVCAELGVALRVHRPGAPHGNVQAWAREERYRAAGSLEGEIAVGHTASDQVETILYRLASSPSRRALLGMRPRAGRVLRPLVRYTREDTAAHCRSRRLSWREDPTNDSDRYARNRIRHELVPALRSIHPAAEANVLALAEILRDEAEVLDSLVDELTGGDGIEIGRLRELPGAMRRLVVQRLADAVAGGPAAGAGRRAPEVCELAEGAALDLPGGVRATVRGGHLRLLPTPSVQRRSRPGPGDENAGGEAPTYIPPA